MISGKERVREILEKYAEEYHLSSMSEPTTDNALSQISSVVDDCLGKDKKEDFSLARRDLAWNARSKQFRERWGK